jgi:hypothetical protein
MNELLVRRVEEADAGGTLPCSGTSLQNLSVPALCMMAVVPDAMGIGDVGLVAL